jgi:hypothetical protein
MSEWEAGDIGEEIFCGFVPSLFMFASRTPIILTSQRKMVTKNLTNPVKDK